MTRNALTALAAAAVLAVALPAQAQGGHGHGKHGTSRQPARPGVQQRDRQHDQSRNRLRDCTGAADRLQRRARDMAEAAGKDRFGSAQAGVHRQRLHREFQRLEGEHERYLRGLGETDRTRLQDRLRDMDRSRQSVRERLRLMDEECARPAPDRLRLQEHARELEREMEGWRQQYRGID
jgi:hypothetical protein